MYTEQHQPTAATRSRSSGGRQRDYAAIANAYAEAAVKDRAGKKHCKWVRLAAQRHLKDLKRRRWAYSFVPEEAARACRFIERLPHVEGEWPTATIALEPWQIFIIASLFGWRHKSDPRRRRFDTAYLEVARKNAKSTLSAGIALYCLTSEGENGPQVKCAATTGDQARIVWGIAKRMVEKTPALREALGLEPLANNIVCWRNGGDCKPINAKASTQDGLNPHCTIIDELHAHKTRDLFDVLRSARGARKNPLSWYVTTAGYDVTGVCYEQRTLVTKILQGIVPAEHYFGIIYTLDEGDSEFDETKWIKPNPNLGVSVQLGELQSYAQEAKVSPATHGEFLTKRMNVWTSAKNGHVNMTLWQRCGGAVNLEELERIPCYGGLDLAAVTDMAAFRLVWKVGERIKTWGRYYLPEETVRPRTERGNVPYQIWADQGLLTLTPGNVIDTAFIEADIRKCLDRFAIQAIAYDPWNARDIVNRLVEAGAQMVEFRQGIPSFNGPMKEIDRAYTSGLLDHGGDPILAWNASNVVVRKDVNENIAPDRKNSQEKIDGYVALLMAVGLMMTAEPESDAAPLITIL